MIFLLPFKGERSFIYRLPGKSNQEADAHLLKRILASGNNFGGCIKINLLFRHLALKLDDLYYGRRPAIRPLPGWVHIRDK
jgi:hypothetical protein